MELSKRDNTIDIVKGITIFLMVWGHNAFGSFVHEKIYLFHIPLFFFISGFFLKNKSNSLNQFIVSKINRLIFPFIFYWCIIRIWNIIFTFVTSGFNINNVREYILSQNFFPSTGALWFLISLFIVSIVSYIIVYKFRLRLIYILCTACLFNVIAYYLPYKEGVFPLYYGQSLIMFSFFIFGFWSYNFKFKTNATIYTYFSKLSIKRNITLTFISGCLLFFIKWDDVDINTQIWPNVFSLYFGATLGIIFTFSISKLFNMTKNRLLKTLSEWGRNSIHILGLHICIMFLIWYIVIPLYIRIAPHCGLTLYQGHEIRLNVHWLVLLVSITTTIISSQIGQLIEKKMPYFFGVTKKK